MDLVETEGGSKVEEWAIWSEAATIGQPTTIHQPTVITQPSKTYRLSKGREGQREGGGDGGDGEESVEDDGGGWSEWGTSRGGGTQKLLQRPGQWSLWGGQGGLTADMEAVAAPRDGDWEGGKEKAATAVLPEDATCMEYDRCFDEEVAHKVRQSAM